MVQKGMVCATTVTYDCCQLCGAVNQRGPGSRCDIGQRCEPDPVAKTWKLEILLMFLTALCRSGTTCCRKSWQCASTKREGLF